MSFSGAGAQSLRLAAADGLGNTEVAKSAGTLSLQSAALVEGTLTLSGGALSQNGFDLSVNGSLAVQSGTTLTQGANDLVIGGMLTVAGTLDAGSSGAGNVLAVSGDADFSGGTYSAGAETLEFRGAAAQAFTPSGKSFAAIALNKTGANAVTMSGSAVSGGLSIASAVSVFVLDAAAASVSLELTDGAGVSNSGTLRIANAPAAGPRTASLFSTGTFSFGGTDIDYNGQKLYVGGISTAVATTLEAAEQLELSGAAAYSGGITLNGDATTLFAAGAHALSSGTVTLTYGTLSVGSGGAGSLDTGAGSLDVGANGVLSVGSGATPVVSCASFGSSGTVSVAGVSTIGVSGAFTNTGTLTLSAATALSVGGDAALGSAGTGWANLALSMSGNPASLSAGQPFGSLSTTGTASVSLGSDIDLAGSLSVPVGTVFAVNGRTLTVHGTLDVAGTFDASTGSSAVTLFDDWTVASGAGFDAGTSTVTFSGTADQTLSSGGADTAHDFYNLTVNKALGTLSVADALLVSNDLSITGVVSSSMQIETGRDLITDGSFSTTALTIVGRDLDVTGTFSAVGQTVTVARNADFGACTTLTPPAVLSFSGATNASFTAGSETFAVISLNKGTATFTLNDSITLSGDFTVAGGTGTLAIGNPLSIDSGGDITFGTKIDSANSLSLTSVGTIGFGAAVGSVTPLTGLSVANGGLLTISSPMTLSGAFAQTGAGSCSLSANLDASGYDVGFVTAVSVEADIVVRAKQLTFGSTVTAGNAGTDLVLRSEDIILGGSISVTGELCFYQNVSTQPMTIGADVAGEYSIGDAELTRITGASAVRFGEAGVQSGAVTLRTAAMPAAVLAVPVVIASDAGAGSIVFDDEGTGTGFSSGSGGLTVAAGSGGIVSAQAAGTNADIAVAGSVSLGTSAAIGSGTRLDFAAAQSGVSITGAPSGVWLSGLGSLTLSSVTTLGGALDVNSEGPLTLNGAVTTTGGNAAFSAASGEIAVNAAVMTGAGSISFASPTTLSANLTTGGGTIGFGAAADVTLGADVTLVSGDGDVSFASSVSGTTAGTESLTISAGTGSVSFSAGVGSPAVGLAALTVSSGAVVTFSATADVAGTLSVANSGLLSLDGAAALGAFLQSGTGDVAIAAAVSTGGTFTQGGSGDVTVSAAVASSGGSISFAGPLALSANLTTGGGDISFAASSAVSLGADVALSTGGGTGDILFSGTLDGASSLTLSTGSGTIGFGAPVGAATALTDLTLRSADIAVNAGASIAVQTELRFYHPDPTAPMNIGADVAGEYSLGDAELSRLTGAAQLVIGEAGVQSEAVRFLTAAVPAVFGNIEVYANAAAGRIVFDDEGAGSGFSFSGADVDFTAGTGGILSQDGSNSYADIAVSGAAIGFSSGASVGKVTTVPAEDNPIQVQSGHTAVNISSAPGGVYLEGLGGQLALGSIGGVGTELVLSNGSGDVVLSSDITTAGADIVFNSPVVIDGALVQLSTGLGGGTIRFGSTLDGTDNTESVSFTSGTGDICFTGAIGLLDALHIFLARDVTFKDTVQVVSITQYDADISSFEGNVSLSGNLSLTTTDSIGMLAPVSIGGDCTITNGGLLTFPAAADFTVTGSFIQDGAGSVVTAGDIAVTGSGSSLSFASPVTLTGNVLFDISAADGPMTFASSVNGPFRLSLSSDAGTAVFSAAVTVGSNTGPSLSVAPTSGAGKIVFLNTLTTGSGIVSNGDVDFHGNVTINAGNTPSDSASSFSADVFLDNMTLTSAGSLTFGDDAVLDSLTLSGGLVTITTAAAGTNQLFISRVDGVDSAQNLVLDSGSGSIQFTGSVGSITPPVLVQIDSASSLTVSGAFTADELLVVQSDTVSLSAPLTAASFTISVAGSVSVSDTVTVTGNALMTADTLTVNAAVQAGSFTVVNTGLLLFSDVSTVDVLAGDFSQKGPAPDTAGDVEFHGRQLSASGNISFQGEVFIASNTSDPIVLDGGRSGAAITDSISFASGLHIAAPGTTVIFRDNLSVKNFLLYEGTVTLRDSDGSGGGSNDPVNLTVSGDLVLLGAEYGIDDTRNPSDSQLTGLFRYDHAARSIQDWDPADHPLAAALPSGTAVPSVPAGTPVYSGSFTDLAGSTISVGKNFYANGIDLTGNSADWTIALQTDPGSSSGSSGVSPSFAEAYNSTVNNSHVTGGFIAAAETDAAKASASAGVSANNSGWDFAAPAILAEGDGAPGTGTWTEYDTVIRVEFNEAIENSNNEIWNAVVNAPSNYFTTNGGTVHFTGSYTDSDCTAPTTGAGDLSVFYLLVDYVSNAWNTDATGSASGDPNSTDRGRADIPGAGGTAPRQGRTVVPDLSIAKAAADLYASLRDSHGNRIGSYGFNGNPLFTGTADHTKPVLVSVETGRASHVAQADRNDPGVFMPYDAHNYFRLRYSEPVNIGNLSADLSPAELETVENIRAESTFTDAGSHGGLITSTIPGTVEVTGFFSYSGAIENGSRDGIPAESLYRTLAENPAGEHGITIFLSGYSDGAAPDFFWPGFFTGASDPEGVQATVPVNSGISDAYGNTIEEAAWHEGSINALLVKPPVTITRDVQPAGFSETDGSGVIGWDIVPPKAAPYSTSAFEIVTLNTDADKLIDRLEMHFLDRFLESSAADLWDPSTGHPDSAGGIRETSLKDSSLNDIVQSFGISDSQTGAAVNTFNVRFESIVDNLIFTGSSGSNAANDDGYLSLVLTDSGYSWDLVTQLYLSYDSTVGHVTDLSGNLLASFTNLMSVERNPPRILLSRGCRRKESLHQAFRTCFPRYRRQRTSLRLSDS